MSPLAAIVGQPGTLGARDGSMLVARRWVAPGGPAATLVLLPDIDEPSEDYDAWAAVIADLGVEVRAVEVRPRPGRERGAWDRMLDDVEDAMASARAALPDRPVALHGQGVAAILAVDYATSERPPPDLLWLSSPAAAPARGGWAGVVRRLVGRSVEDEVGRDIRAATARAFGRVERLRIPVRLLFGGDDSRTDRLAWFALRERIELNWVIYNGVGHAIQRGGDWRQRAEEMARAIYAHGVQLGSETTPPPSKASGERLTRAEARAQFREHVATEGDRIARFVARVGILGGPTPGCERAELARLGAWMIDALEEGQPSGPEPTWASEWRTWHGPVARLSTDTLWLIDGLGAWFAQCYRTLFPDVEWELDTFKASAYYHRPVLGTLSPPSPARNVVEAARKDPPDVDWLGRIWDAYAKAAAERPAAPVAEPEDELLDGVTVELVDHPGWDMSIWVPEAAESVLGQAVFESLADRMGALPGVVELAWEDREVMLVRVQDGLTPEALRPRVVGALEQARREGRTSRRGRGRRGGPS